MSKNGSVDKWIDGFMRFQTSAAPAVPGRADGNATERGVRASPFASAALIKLQLQVRASCTVKRRERRAPLLQQLDSPESILSVQSQFPHQSHNPSTQESILAARC